MLRAIGTTPLPVGARRPGQSYAEGMDGQWVITATLPAVTLVLGALLNQWTSARLEKVQLERELKTRQDEREQARLDRREEFELTHLGNLHAALDELAKALATYSAHLKYERHQTPGAEEAFREASGKLRSLVNLTLDDKVRDLAGTAHDHVLQLHLGEVGTGPTTTEPAAASALGRAEFAVASRMRDVYKSDNLPAPK